MICGVFTASGYWLLMLYFHYSLEKLTAGAALKSHCWCSYNDARRK